VRSFWEWNALKEQSSGRSGPDPFDYGITGDTRLTFNEWRTMTAAYYGSGGGGTGGAGGASTAGDTATTVLGGALALAYVLGRFL
jgi:hypothetical protein